MILIIINNSKKKSFRRTDRIINQLMPSVDKRINICDLPKRIILQLIDNLKKATTKGTSISIFVESKEGFRGFKCIEIGVKRKINHDFLNVNSNLDSEFKLFKYVS